jgi:hypothetical protein
MCLQSVLFEVDYSLFCSRHMMLAFYKIYITLPISVSTLLTGSHSDPIKASLDIWAQRYFVEITECSCKVVSIRVLEMKKALCLEAVRRSGSIAPPFKTSALDGGEWSVSHPGLFTPRERDPDSHWIGGWMGPRTGLDDMEKTTS